MPVDLTAVTESPVSGTVSISDTVEIPQPEVFQTPEIVAPSVEAPPPSEPSLPEKSYSHGDTQEIHTEEIRIVSVLSSKRPIITLYDVVEEPPSK